MPEFFKRIPWLDFVLIFGILLVSLGIAATKNVKDNKTLSFTKKISPTPPVETLHATSLQRQNITIDISGEVTSPGVYKLPADSRYQDALIAAGGLGPKADRDWVSQNINLSKTLKDEDKIYIPRPGLNITKVAQTVSTANPTALQKVSLNHGTFDQLVSVNGIGEATARSIISFREKQSFGTIEDLKKVPGIGQKTFEKIAPQVGL